MSRPRLQLGPLPTPGRYLVNYPSEVLNREARILGVGGDMLGERLLHRPGQVIAPIEVVNRLAGDILRIVGCYPGERLIPALASE